MSARQMRLCTGCAQDGVGLAGMRPAVIAIYRFARVADDLADEGDAPASERLRALGAWLTTPEGLAAHLYAG